MDLVRRIQYLQSINMYSVDEQNKLEQSKKESNELLVNSAGLSLVLGALIGISGKHKPLRRKVMEAVGVSLVGITLGSIYAVNQYLAKAYVIH